jgi:hypothetical protein
MANGVAHGQGKAFAAGNAQQHDLKSIERGAGQSATQAKQLKGKKQVDHLGLEN